MQVYLIAYRFLPQQNAQVRRIEAWANALSNANFNITVICGNADIKAPNLATMANYKVLSLATHTGIANKLRQKKIPFGIKRIIGWLYLLLFRRSPESDFWPHFKKARHLLKNAPDCVIVSAPPAEMFHLGLKLQQLYNCNLILDFRDALFGHTHKPKRNGWAYGWEFLLKPIVKKALQRANAAITVSDTLAKHLQTRNKSFAIIQNGYPIAWENINFEKQYSDNVFRLLYVGTLFDIQDAQNDLLKGLEMLQNNNPHLVFEITFAGSSAHSIQNRVQKCNIQLQNLRCLSNVNTTELIQLYKQADVLIHATYTGQPALVSTKVFEYLVTKKPILLLHPDNGDLHQIIKDYPLFFDATSKETIYEKLKALHSLKKQEFGSYAFGLFARERQASILINIINNL